MAALAGLPDRTQARTLVAVGRHDLVTPVRFAEEIAKGNASAAIVRSILNLNTHSQRLFEEHVLPFRGHYSQNPGFKEPQQELTKSLWSICMWTVY